MIAVDMVIRAWDGLYVRAIRGIIPLGMRVLLDEKTLRPIYTK